MALTINRKEEIKNEEFVFIKQKFNQNTNSQALYACVKFVVNQVPTLEAEINRLALKADESDQKYNNLIETIKKKHVVDNEFKSILFSE